MDPSLAGLISELNTKSSMTLQGARLPDEQIIIKIGESKNSEALPHLEEALRSAEQFKRICENLQKQVNTGSAGSASPFIAAMLAEQSIRSIREAIAQCR